MCGSPATLAGTISRCGRGRSRSGPSPPALLKRRSQFEDPLIQHDALSVQVDDFAVDAQKDAAAAVDQQR